MGIIDIFSKRRKRNKGEEPEIYVYDIIPEPLRVQIVHIWNDTLGDNRNYNDDYNQANEAYDYIRKSLCREYGVFCLIENPSYDNNGYKELVSFILSEESTDKVIDTIELSFRVIDNHTRNYEYLRRDPDYASKCADNAIKELNVRLQEHGIGYQYENGEIIRIDSQYLHSRVVKPALKLLDEKHYKGVNEEFLKAHEHYRHGRYKECLNESLKAFESIMKAICDKNKWAYNKTDTAKTLIDICFDKNLIPPFWQSHFTSLRAMLESGIPTARNKLSGHGQGSSKVEVPQYLASYILHMTAATLLFFAESEKQIV